MFTLEALVTKDAILAEVLRHPDITSKKKVTPAQGMKAAGACASALAIAAVAAQVIPKLQEAYEMHELTYGEVDILDDNNADEWHSALDDAAENVAQEYSELLSADWLGKNTVDARLHEEGNIEGFAKSMGAEVYKTLTAGKKPGQVLSALGVVQDDVVAALSALEGTRDDNSTQAETVAVLQVMVETIGSEFDPLALYDELEMASGDDDILANGAIERIGGAEMHVPVLRLFRSTMGAGAVDALLEMITNLAADPHAYGEDKLHIPQSLKRDSEPAGITPKEAPEGSLDPEVLKLLKAHANVMDKDVAERLGISRATFNNKVNGKGQPITDPAQIAIIREILSEHANALVKAVHMLDGTPVE